METTHSIIGGLITSLEKKNMMKTSVLRLYKEKKTGGKKRWKQIREQIKIPWKGKKTSED